jgi:hypothetical protein
MFGYTTPASSAYAPTGRGQSCRALPHYLCSSVSSVDLHSSPACHRESTGEARSPASPQATCPSRSRRRRSAAVDPKPSAQNPETAKQNRFAVSLHPRGAPKNVEFPNEPMLSFHFKNNQNPNNGGQPPGGERRKPRGRCWKADRPSRSRGPSRPGHDSRLSTFDLRLSTRSRRDRPR